VLPVPEYRPQLAPGYPILSEISRPRGHSRIRRKTVHSLAVATRLAQVFPLKVYRPFACPENLSMILLLKRSLVEWKGVTDQMQVSRRPSQVGRVKRVQGNRCGSFGHCV